MEQEIKHPDPDRWWRRKWKLAIAGAGFSFTMVALGFAAAWIGGKEISNAVHPFASTAMWGGMIPLVAYVSNSIGSYFANIKR